MELSWAAIIVFPILITPAILLLLLFRLIVPKSRTPQSNDFIFLLLFIIFSGVTNLNLVIDLLQHFLQIPNLTENDSTSKVLDHLLKGIRLSPSRPFKWTFEHLTGQVVPKENLFCVIPDLHIRPLIYGAGILTIGKLLERLKYLMEALPFLPDGITPWEKVKHWCLAFTWDLLGYGKVWNNGASKKATKKAWLSKFVTYFQEVLYSPWNILADYNLFSEVQMVDVFSDDESIYSGILSSWVLDKDDSAAISMHNTIRYYPQSSGKIKRDNDRKEDSQLFSDRKMRFVKNNGDMIIPYDRAKTIHTWQIRRGTEVSVWIYDANTEEKFKWYLGLVHNYPDFFKKIKIKIYLTNEASESFQKRIADWIDVEELDLPDDIFEILYFDKSKEN